MKTMAAHPSVSCVITAFNYGAYVAETIESALAQDYPADRLEIVVVDDGSTDHTAAEVARFGDRVRLIRQPNAGVIAATNRGIAEARGELIALLDADDLWLPHKTAAQVERFARPEVGLVYGNMELMDGAGATLHADHFAAHGVVPPTGRVLGDFMVRNLACTATIMVRRSLLAAFWPLPLHMWCQDWWTALRVAAVAELDCVPEPVTRYRVHPDSNSAYGDRGAKWLRTQAGDLALRRYSLRHLDLDAVPTRRLATIWSTYRQQLATLCDGTGRPAAAHVPVTAADRERSSRRVEAARAAIAAGDHAGAARCLLAAAAEDPLDARLHGALEDALELCAERPAPAASTSGLLARERFVCVAFAEEVLEQPALLDGYASALAGNPGCTLALYAPGADGDAMAAGLGPVLEAAGLDGADTDVTLLAPADDGAAADVLDGAHALLSARPAEGELAWLAPVAPAHARTVLPVLAAGAEPAAAIGVRPPRVLCYAPSNLWALHGQWDMTVMHRLRNAGADVQYVMCDGLYAECDVFWAATEPRPANACQLCQAHQANLAAQLGMEFEWLGRYLLPAERREAIRWARGLADEEVPTARYGDWDVAEWITGSVHSHFRASRLDWDDPEVGRAFRRYLYSGLVACFALDRLLDDFAPDVLFTFNGRQSSTRVAFELARRRDIRVVCHERGLRQETLTLVEDADCISLEPLRQYWREWGDVPLSSGELQTVSAHLAEREHGQGLSWRAFTSAPQPHREVRAGLRLDATRPTWVLFTSSDDEVASEARWQGAFATQLDWIRHTVAYAGRHPELDLVIRVHPNTGSERSTGANRGQLEELARLRRELPPNARMVDAADDVSSYSLMDIAAVGLVYNSTVALELACKGKATVVAAGNAVAGMPFVRTVGSPGDYDALLDELAELAPGALFPDVARLAHRFAYGQFHRMPIEFPLVRMPSSSQGVVQWQRHEQLQPGVDAGLDRCARILLEGEPVCPPPGPAELARDARAELVHFGGAVHAA
jgi:hypothetical protein